MATKKRNSSEWVTEVDSLPFAFIPDSREIKAKKELALKEGMGPSTKEFVLLEIKRLEGQSASVKHTAAGRAAIRSAGKVEKKGGEQEKQGRWSKGIAARGKESRGRSTRGLSAYSRLRGAKSLASKRKKISQKSTVKKVNKKSQEKEK